MRSKKKLLLLLIPLAVAGVLVYRFLLRPSGPPPGVIPVSGNVEVTDAEVSFQVPGHVEERLVSEGQLVDEGQVVARLDDSELARQVAVREAERRAAQAALDELLAGSRPEEVASARAAVQEAEARLQELTSGSRPQEIKAAEAALEGARAAFVRSESEFERQQELHQRDVTSQQKYEDTQAAYREAEARLEEARQNLDLVREGPRQEDLQRARAALEQARQQYELVREGPRQERIAAATARLQQAEAALELARTRLGYATLHAPLSGVVLSDHAEPGEYVAAGTPVVTVGDLEHVWVRAYINETDLGRVKVGQDVEVITDTYPDRIYPGTLSFIASEAEFTPKNVQTREQRVKLVYRVKIDVENPDMELKPGMPADARILVGEER